MRGRASKVLSEEPILQIELERQQAMANATDPTTTVCTCDYIVPRRSVNIYALTAAVQFVREDIDFFVLTKGQPHRQAPIVSQHNGQQGVCTIGLHKQNETVGLVKK